MLIADNWVTSQPIEAALPSLIRNIEQWNKEVFGDIIARKRQLIARIKGVQRRLDDYGDSRLHKLDGKLRLDLEAVLDDEESLWKQKSCSEWLAEGDRNTKYYHSRTMQRRKRNKIRGLRLNGEWCFEDSKLKQATVDFFQELYKVDGIVTDRYGISGYFPSINSEDMEHMRKPISKGEVHRALTDMPPLKAPGPDGCHAQLFQSQWEVMGDSVFDFVKKVFEGADIHPEINRTTIVLLPKISGPELISQFRPIGLNSVLYKILTSTIVNRLRKIMPKIVSNNQASFIPGRCITDNILIAQEAIHTMRTSKGLKKWMAVKIDLEKAYDRLRWDFLQDSLLDAGLSNEMTAVIMRCVSSATLQILWNGTPTEHFTPTRGIRQGDPLSPYLFVIAMERLGHAITRGVATGTWKPLFLKKRCPPLSHLFFADDLLVFCEASSDQADNLNTVLNNFCHYSGHRISAEKTQVCFSKNVPDGLADNLCRKLNYKRVADLGMYLGVPLFHSRVTAATYSFVIEKVRKKLNGWDAKCLSRAGRVTLAKSVLMVIPNYFMQSALIPVKVWVEIEKIVRTFVWGTTNGKRNKPLVNWKDCCSPKDRGGLGFRNLQTQNMAFLMKLGYQLITNQKALWVQILRTKYNVKELCPVSINRSECSFIWKSLAAVWTEVRQGLYWQINNGKNTMFWSDEWVPTIGPLWEQCRQGVIIDMGLRVSEMANQSTGWNWARIKELVNPNCWAAIAGICPPDEALGDDKCAWKWGDKGKFTVTDTYNHLAMPSWKPRVTRYNLAWNYVGPERVRHFLWVVLRDRLMSNMERCRRHFADDPSCHICGNTEETSLHILRDCSVARSIWKRLVPNTEQNRFFSSELVDWMQVNLESKSLYNNDSCMWSCLFGIVCWKLWKKRNITIFSHVNVDSCDVIPTATAWARYVFRYKTDSKQMKTPSNCISRWVTPPVGWVKLNTDASVMTTTSLARAGGVLRDAEGQWLAGFTKNLGIADVFHAEAMGILAGLQLAWELGIRRLVIENDNSMLMSSLQHADIELEEDDPAIQRIRHLRLRPWETQIRFARRESNQIADVLAKTAPPTPDSLIILDTPPMAIMQQLNADISNNI